MKERTKDLMKKVQGPAWASTRTNFESLVNLLLSVSPEAAISVSTVYAVFAVDKSTDASPYAVIWFKNSKKWVLGLALPEDVRSPHFVPKPLGKGYRGVTKYLNLDASASVPQELKDWAKASFDEAARRDT